MNHRFVFAAAVVAAATCASAAVTNTVKSAAVGEVRVVCDKPGDWSFDLSCEGSGGRDVVTVRLSSPKEAMPPVFTLSFMTSGAKTKHVWTSNYAAKNDVDRLWPWAWRDWQGRYSSQLASQTPIAVAYDGEDHAELAIACSDAFNAVNYWLYAYERTCVLEGKFQFFTQPVAATKEYSVKVLIDRRERFWADAVRDATDWIVATAGLRPAETPAAAYDPLYSTWYAYWQDVHDKPLEREAEIAASLGMKTMILDDGWQKVESKTFYSATGDWMPVKSRFPDMKAHVDAVHKAGLKYMLWLSVPYVGDESQAWNRFKGKFLKNAGRDTAVLDPRFPEVREYLVKTYERVIGEWGFDGVKLDFIDQFTLPSPDPAVKENYAGRDIKSLPQAVDTLMKEILVRLRAIKPDVLIEFRQAYMGPAIQQYGNMMRAADCPADPQANRRRIANLRLTSGKMAVHSDMLVWSRDETPEGAALPILNALFSTIQYSMILDTVRDDHKEVIRHWIGFTQRHVDTLQKGDFRPHHPQLGFPVIEAESAAERIVAVYADVAFAKTGALSKPVYLINATSSAGVVAELPAAAQYEIFDTFGRKVAGGRCQAGICRLPVPAAGYAKIR